MERPGRSAEGLCTRVLAHEILCVRSLLLGALEVSLVAWSPGAHPRDAALPWQRPGWTRRGWCRRLQGLAWV